jgi:hypothetical protein
MSETRQRDAAPGAGAGPGGRTGPVRRYLERGRENLGRHQSVTITLAMMVVMVILPVG